MTITPRTTAYSDGPEGPVIPFRKPEGAVACPIKTSMGVFGRKWALVVLRDLAFLPEPTFGRILRKNPGLTPRVLSLRLRELRAESLVEKVADARDDRKFHYRLTQRGRDAIPILAALIAFGMEHHSAKVFSDGRPRAMGEVFPDQQAQWLGKLYDYATESPRARYVTMPPRGAG